MKTSATKLDRDVVLEQCFRPP